MRAKILSLALALTLCLGVAVPTFAAGTETYTVDGITITIDSSGTISYTGSGTLTGYTAEGGIMLLHEATNGYDGIDTVTISIGSGITIDDDIIDGMDLLKYMEKFLMKNYSVKSVNIYSSTMNVQTFGGFTDVKENDYFADPVLWAVDKKITAGTSETTFSPNENCTVAQILSFLWRAYGSPSTNTKNPFSDVKSSDYYYNAARWAYDKGMVTGSTFGGDRPCTRSMAVTYMWQAAGVAYADFAIYDGYLNKYTGSSSDVVIPNIVSLIDMDWYPEPKKLTSVTIPSSVTLIGMDAFYNCDNLTDVYYEGSEAQWQAIKVEEPISNNALSKATIHYNSKMPEKVVNTGFTDVPSTADCAEAVKWAVDKGVTAGTSATTFSPDSVCTRGQIVTFLHRALAK